jgi:acyl-homoserine lactone acylase PvdQ
LRGDITDDDIEALFLPEDHKPPGETTAEPTPRPGTTIVYDEFGIAHVTGETREDMAFGAGWVTARDRGLLVDLGRGPARVAVADVPGIDAFGLVTSGQEFIPSDATEQLLTDQVALLVETYGAEGEQIIAEAQAYADGLTAFWEENDIDQEPATVNDVVAVTAFIGSIFGAGGGAEADHSELLSVIEDGLGEDIGGQAWDDVMLFDDPEAPTTIDTPFDYPVLTGGEVTGSVQLDAGSIVSFDPLAPAADDDGVDEDAVDEDGVDEDVLYRSAGPVPRREASNWLMVDPEHSVNGTSLAVMGPQLGYYYPEIVQQIHLSAPGIEAQGVGVPGLSMYLLIGRTKDYAWSLTSAGNDVRDVFAEKLCNPDGSAPTVDSGHYEFDGECTPLETFEAGTLNGERIAFAQSVHGAVIGTATADGEPVALTRQRSTFGRDALNLAALKSMTEGEAETSEDFFDAANEFGFTFNWSYVNRQESAFFSSGYLPVRAEGLDRRLPTTGSGEYEWDGFLERDEHPHAIGHPEGRLLNWNNKAAPGFMHGDTNSYGSVHRVEMFEPFTAKADLASVVGVMNTAATRSPDSGGWPTVSDLLAGGQAPSPLADAVVDELDAWLEDAAPQVDADDDGFNDDAGPTIIGALWAPLVQELIRPVFGDLTPQVFDARGLSGLNGQSVADKDLRTLLGEDVDGPFNLQYCGGGDLDACREALWGVVDDVSAELSEQYGGDDPALWLSEGSRIEFQPGLIPDTSMRATNRPTFQQVLEFAPGD